MVAVADASVDPGPRDKVAESGEPDVKLIGASSEEVRGRLSCVCIELAESNRTGRGIGGGSCKGGGILSAEISERFAEDPIDFARRRCKRTLVAGSSVGPSDAGEAPMVCTVDEVLLGCTVALFLYARSARKIPNDAGDSSSGRSCGLTERGEVWATKWLGTAGTGGLIFVGVVGLLPPVVWTVKIGGPGSWDDDLLNPKRV